MLIIIFGHLCHDLNFDGSSFNIKEIKENMYIEASYAFLTVVVKLTVLRPLMTRKYNKVEYILLLIYYVCGDEVIIFL